LGLEELVGDELTALGYRSQKSKGAQILSGLGWRDVWRLNLTLRTANRVLVVLGSWGAADDEGLYVGARRLVESTRGWGGVSALELFDPRSSLALHSSSRRSAIRDTRWIALKVKDAIVDAQRRRYSQRSSVDRENADLPLRVFLDADRATLLLDTSGRSLDHRGYRVQTVAAPLREHLAAACVLATGWRGEGPVLDPMCGSGTLLIEAAWAAQRRAPGLQREGWIFERLPSFDRRVYERLRQELAQRERPVPAIFGYDHDPTAIAAARENLRLAGLDPDGSGVHLRCADGLALTPEDVSATPGLILINPAYGARLAAETDDWRRLGDWLKRFRGWTAVVIAGDERLGKDIGLKPRRRMPVFNGPLEARILIFDLY
jgi:23S rRNA G2445 N2-methylase RlmL